MGGFTSDIQGPNVDDMKESTTVHSKKVDEPFPLAGNSGKGGS